MEDMVHGRYGTCEIWYIEDMVHGRYCTWRYGTWQILLLLLLLLLLLQATYLRAAKVEYRRI